MMVAEKFHEKLLMRAIYENTFSLALPRSALRKDHIFFEFKSLKVMKKINKSQIKKRIENRLRAIPARARAVTIATKAVVHSTQAHGLTHTRICLF